MGQTLEDEHPKEVKSFSVDCTREKWYHWHGLDVGLLLLDSIMISSLQEKEEDSCWKHNCFNDIARKKNETKSILQSESVSNQTMI